MQSTSDTRVRILVSGIVQGVGFRPYVHTLASRHSLSGFVRNNSGIVEIEVEGRGFAVDSFMQQLKEQAPPLASIRQIFSEVLKSKNEPLGKFSILESERNPAAGEGLVPSDTATCADCLVELFDPSNRRFRYPFINCTNCGPRFTIMSHLPYDRSATTMAAFAMCRLCQEEFDEPADRRFHAQPNACAKCGPSLTYLPARHGALSLEGARALAGAVEQLKQGLIIALKGLGGFQLVCDAANDAAIGQLRRRKRRNAKPFALMMTDLDMVKLHCSCSQEESKELSGPLRPIVLLERLSMSRLSAEIAPGINRLGVMLPYTPLHHLLLFDFGLPLIVTSANLSEEPIAKENEEALDRLKGLADGFLLHNREIQSRYDDSVVQYAGKYRTIIRRARGIAPLPINLPFSSDTNALACGAHLKNTFCLIRHDQAFVSQHIGDLGSIETHKHFQETFDVYKQLFKIEPELVAHDYHPDYFSTDFAEQLAGDRGLPRFPVQHHHAHIVSCMVENGLTEPVIGIAFDGLGYGLDETVWGGEFLFVTLKEMRRLGYFQPVPLPGGTAAIKRPWRMALSYILSDQEKGKAPFANFIDTLYDRYDKTAVELTFRQIATRLNSPLTSSCGRMFDAMSAMLGLCFEADYEGQAAMMLEALALSRPFETIDLYRAYDHEIIGGEPPFVIDTRRLLLDAYLDFTDGTTPADVAVKFHCSIASLVLSVCEKIRKLNGCSDVCLGGGVFQNTLLLRLVEQFLTKVGFRVFFPRQLPANDGGLSLGQAVIALARFDAIRK